MNKVHLTKFTFKKEAYNWSADAGGITDTIQVCKDGVGNLVRSMKATGTSNMCMSSRKKTREV